MAQANFYFNKFQHAGEQNLIADLVTESISIYGMDVGYLAKTIVEYDELLTEVDLAQFNQVSDVVMYIKSADGFQGEGDFLSKFGLEIRDQMTLCIARRHFTETVQQEQSISRPREGDLIFLPLNEKIFQINFVEHEPVFYQMGALQFYEITCELFEYSNERFDTGIEVIDLLEETHSLDTVFGTRLLLENGDDVLLETGYRLVQEIEATGDDQNFLMAENLLDQIILETGFGLLLESQPEEVDYDDRTDAENVFIETQADAFIDFSTGDPFSEGGRF
tara:strand:+ start:161 stop:994 length:834 start_codon:yes stop_codon:yes gene_type:complete